jgi:hypothetical protein
MKGREINLKECFFLLIPLGKTQKALLKIRSDCHLLLYIAGYQFNSSGLDTWVDIIPNLGGALPGYFVIWLWKYGRKPKTASA